MVGAVGVSGGAVGQDLWVAQTAAAAAQAQTWEPSAVAKRGRALVQAGGTNAMQSSTEETNRTLIARAFDAWRDGTGSPYDLLADDAHWTITGKSVAARTYPSREAFLSEVIRPFNARMHSRLVPVVRRLYAEGDTVIAFFDASGTARDGTTYANTYAWFMEMKDGRIVRAHAFFDSIAFDAFWQRVTPVSGA
jgi:ketosteroid isomerase-like protein